MSNEQKAKSESINEILLRRRSHILFNFEIEKEAPSPSKKALVISFAKNVEAYGFKFSKNLFFHLLKVTGRCIYSQLPTLQGWSADVTHPLFIILSKKVCH